MIFLLVCFKIQGTRPYSSPVSKEPPIIHSKLATFPSQASFCIRTSAHAVSSGWNFNFLASSFHLVPTQIQHSQRLLLQWSHVNSYLLLVVIQSLSHVRLFGTSWTAATRPPCSYLLEFAPIHVCWASDVTQPTHPLLRWLDSIPLLLLPSIFPSTRVFSNESALHIRWPKYSRFMFRISPSNEYSGLISFRIDWFDLLAVQGTLRSLLQHNSSKASNLQCSAYFMVQLSHPYFL